MDRATRPQPPIPHYAPAPPRPDVVPESLDPVVAAMPSAAETSIEAVARYIAAREPDRRLRIKALHDWVADRIAYDVVALERIVSSVPSPGLAEIAAFQRPGLQLSAPCDSAPSLCRGGGGWHAADLTSAPPKLESSLAERAFEERKAVCAGYAALLHALGEAIGEDILVVTGEASTLGGPRFGGALQGHAWNAVDLGRGIELIDVTWDAGSVDGTRFTKRYGTRWLFVPPKEFVTTHVSEDELRWDPEIRIHPGGVSDRFWTKDSRFALGGDPVAPEP